MQRRSTPIFSLLPTIVPLFFVVVVGIIVYTIGKKVAENARNAQAPINQRYARVATKRTHVWGSEHSHTSYYVTFEEQTGERYEWEVNGHWYGQVVEGDIGVLTTQGTAFRNFARQQFA